MPDPSSSTQEAPLEHFELIEDVIKHIRTKLPADSGSSSWKNVCEDVLHCQLPVVEPLLLQELAAVKGDADETNKMRALLRAVSWYRHPPKQVDELIDEVNHLKPTHPGTEDQTYLSTIQDAFERKLEGSEMLKAADAVEALFANASREDQRDALREIRDQVYYQLLYPHWFEVVKRWAATQQPTA